MRLALATSTVRALCRVRAGISVQKEKTIQSKGFVLLLALGFLTSGALLAAGQDAGPFTADRDGTGSRGRFTAGLRPIVRIVSPLADALVAPGEGKVGQGSLNGTGF